jgi:transposase
MRPDIHAVAIKDAGQQSSQSLYRMRQWLVLERTAKSNQIRSTFAEEGMVFPVSIAHLRRSAANATGDPRSAITPILRRLGTMYLEKLSALEGWLSDLNQQLHQIATERDIASC